MTGVERGVSFGLIAGKPAPTGAWQGQVSGAGYSRSGKTKPLSARADRGFAK
jgi:hypothetical protein